MDAPIHEGKTRPKHDFPVILDSNESCSRNSLRLAFSTLAPTLNSESANMGLQKYHENIPPVRIQMGGISGLGVP